MHASCINSEIKNEDKVFFLFSKIRDGKKILLFEILQLCPHKVIFTTSLYIATLLAGPIPVGGGFFQLRTL
jgi:hypothetical protein